jgi:hypothetical protein
MNSVKLDESNNNVKGEIYRPKTKICVFEYSPKTQSFENIQKCFDSESAYVNSILTETHQNGEERLRRINKGTKLFYNLDFPKIAGIVGDLSNFEEVK